jgi:hypothetical protein
MKGANCMDRSVVKVSVNLPSDTVEWLKEIAEHDGITMTEALRRSISTQKFVKETTDKGAKLLIEDPDEKSLRQVVFR